MSLLENTGGSTWWACGLSMIEYRNWYLTSFPWASPQHLLLAVLQATNAGVRPGNEATVEPPNKGHFGNNINSSLLSFVERLSSSRRFKMY